MYNKFIKLTEQYSQSNDRAVWVNPSRICAMHIYVSTQGDLTRIRFNEDTTKSIDVRESPAEIIKLIGALDD